MNTKTSPHCVCIRAFAFASRAGIIMLTCLGLGHLPIAQKAAAAELENQWRNMPDIRNKPEGGGAAKPPVAGGDTWRTSAQQPATVPVQFWIDTKASECTVTATLGGKSVSVYDDGDSSDPYNPFILSPTNVVSLKVNETYLLTITGDDVYMAHGYFMPSTLNNLFSSGTAGQQPARLYNVYFFDPSSRKWLKTCPTTAPTVGVDTYGPINASIQIQVRPNLGARPVTKPGVQGIAGDDQADDSWTRNEPAIDAKVAAGDGEPLTMNSSKLGDPGSVNFAWSVSMGRLWSGANAGRIQIDEQSLSDVVYTPAILSYFARSDDSNEIAALYDLDNTNCLNQVKAPQALACADPLYGSALFATTDFTNVPALVQLLTNHADAVSQFLWTNFSSTAQQTLITNPAVPTLQSTLVQQLNPILQGSSIYTSNRFIAVALSGKTRRLLLQNPSGSDLIRLNRFLVEDTYRGKILLLPSTAFALRFYTAALVGPLDALGYFTLTNNATAFVTWYLGLPAGGTNQWQVQEVRNSATNTTLLQFTPASGLWTLTRGSGNDARVETRTIVTNTASGTNYSTETQAVKNNAGTVCDQTVEVYQRFPWGYDLVTVTNDPAGAKLVTQFTFGCNTNDPPTYGRITSIVHPDGFWERRVYSSYTDRLDKWCARIHQPFRLRWLESGRHPQPAKLRHPGLPLGPGPQRHRRRRRRHRGLVGSIRNFRRPDLQRPFRLL
jgi:hypothetical protein